MNMEKHLFDLVTDVCYWGVTGAPHNAPANLLRPVATASQSAKRISNLGSPQSG